MRSSFHQWQSKRLCEADVCISHFCDDAKCSRSGERAVDSHVRIWDDYYGLNGIHSVPIVRRFILCLSRPCRSSRLHLAIITLFAMPLRFVAAIEPLVVPWPLPRLLSTTVLVF